MLTQQYTAHGCGVCHRWSDIPSAAFASRHVAEGLCCILHQKCAVHNPFKHVVVCTDWGHGAHDAFEAASAAWGLFALPALNASQLLCLELHVRHKIAVLA